MAPLNKITPEELAKHSSADDLWIAINGLVYDVTNFANKHPGGAEPMLEVAGGDGTSDFKDVGHSDDAKKQMQTYLIGKLEGNAIPKKRQENIKTKATSNTEFVPSVHWSEVLHIPIVLLTFAVSIHFLTKYFDAKLH